MILDPGSIFPDQKPKLVDPLGFDLKDIQDLNPSKVWEPQPKQVEFLSIPFEVDEALYGGAAFGGKSEVLLAYPIYHKFYLDPEFIGIIFRRTFPELFKSLLPRTEKFYKPFGGEWNGEEKAWTFKSGAKLFLSYMDSMKAARGHDTNQFNYIGFEELTHFEWEVYNYMISRCRSTTSRLPSIVRSTSNPGNIGHPWVKKRFVDEAPEGGRLMREKLGNGEYAYRIFIKALIWDNPKGLEADPTYINKLMRLPEAEKRAKLYGDWNAYVGEVFGEWREKHYADEPENALHVIEPIQIPYWWPKLAAIDWGYAANCWMGWAAISPERRIFMYREMMFKKTKISTWASEFASATSSDGNFLGVWLDPSAWQNRGEEESIATQFQRFSGFVPKKADNARVSGKLLLHDLMRWKNKPARYVPPEGFNPEVFARLQRDKGDKVALDYLSLFQAEKAETNLPLLQVFNTCRGFIDAVPSCIPSEKNPEDIAEFDGDDPIDGGRYLCKAAVKFLEAGVEEMKSQEALSHVLAKLDATGDQTQFHRMMEIHERNQAPVVHKMRHSRHRRW